MEALLTTIWLQAGFQKWRRAVANSSDAPSYRTAFLAGVMFGQKWSGPASPLRAVITHI